MVIRAIVVDSIILWCCCSARVVVLSHNLHLAAIVSAMVVIGF